MSDLSKICRNNVLLVYRNTLSLSLPQGGECEGNIISANLIEPSPLPTARLPQAWQAGNLSLIKGEDSIVHF